MRPSRNVVLASLLAILAPFFASSANGQVTFDRHCLTINGQDTFIYSGAFHYFRCPKELWHDRLTKMKEAGLNCVETYVAWNVHETQEPGSLEDFSKVDLTDLQDFVKMCHDEFGFYTIIRPGPYICAEWKGGGYPRWILNKKPDGAKAPWLRSDEPAYLDWSRHWYKACTPFIASQQITKRKPGTGGTILYQIENEYDFYNVAGPAKVNHLRALYSTAKECGIDVPIMGCWTRELRNSKDDLLKNCFDGSNCYPRSGLEGMMGQLAKLRQEQPNGPVMIPEMQGGWFSEIGQGTLSEQQPWLTAAQIHNLTIGAIMHETTIMSYYMFFGGTNLGDGASTNITNTYDYGAPLREHGGVDARYFAVKGIGLMLQKHGQALSRSEAVKIETSGDTKNVEIVLRKSGKGDHYLFVRNQSEHEARGGQLQVKGDGLDLSLDVKLEVWDARVLYLPAGKTNPADGEWIGAPVAPMDRPTVDAKPMRIASALMRTDDNGDGWKPVADGRDLLREGVIESRPILYRGTVTLSREQLDKAANLTLNLAGPDPIVAQVNGKIISLRGGMTPSADVASALREGKNEINLLLENQGMPHWGAALDRRVGVMSGTLAPKSAAGQAIVAWRVKEVEARGNRKFTATDIDDSSWDKIELDQRTLDLIKAPIQPGAEPEKWPAARILMNKQATATYRTTLELTDDQIKDGQTHIVFECIDDEGDIFINGEKAAESRDWATPCIVDGSKLLKAGKNQIAVVVRNHEGQGGITKSVRLMGTKDMGPAIAFEFAPQTIGWRDWAKSESAEGWKAVELDTTSELPYVLNGKTRGTIPSEQPTSLATWYAVDFDLPAKTPGVWFPWQARMNLSGNAYVFVNGHNLGRYWEVGPQREFFLPDCWLKYGQKNRITLMVRPTDHGAKLLGMEIIPKTNFAEKR